MSMTGPISAQVDSAVASSSTSDAVSVLALKKAISSQASAALGLIQALPQPPSMLELATSGNIGTRVNVFA
jgi:hypothetical protein